MMLMQGIFDLFWTGNLLVVSAVSNCILAGLNSRISEGFPNGHRIEAAVYAIIGTILSAMAIVVCMAAGIDWMSEWRLIIWQMLLLPMTVGFICICWSAVEALLKGLHRLCAHIGILEPLSEALVRIYELKPVRTFVNWLRNSILFRV